jgi:hypothetical protein
MDRSACGLIFVPIKLAEHQMGSNWIKILWYMYIYVYIYKFSNIINHGLVNISCAVKFSNMSEDSLLGFLVSNAYTVSFRAIVIDDVIKLEL